MTDPVNPSPSLSNQSASDLVFNPGPNADSGPVRYSSEFGPSKSVGPDSTKFTPTNGSRNATPSKPSDVTGDTEDDHDGTMYDGKGNVIPPEQTVPKAATGVFMAGAGAGAGAFVGSKIPIPGAEKATTAWGAGIGGAIGYSTPFNHAINRGANTILYPRGGFSPPTSSEDDMSAFLRE